MKTDERLRVLYVEDDRDSYEMMQVMLGLSQILVFPATSIEDALTLAGSDRFDLYLLDSVLPDGSGFSLCRTLRAVDPATPILFYSGSGYPDEIRTAISAGADACITKPHSEKLAETIIQLVANCRESSHARVSLPVLARAA